MQYNCFIAATTLSRNQSERRGDHGAHGADGDVGGEGVDGDYAAYGDEGAHGHVVGQAAVCSTSSTGPTLPAKDLSLPFPPAERLCVPNDQACREDERKYFANNHLINQVKLTKMTHIRKRQTSKRWIPSQIKEKVLTSSTSGNLLCYSPRNRLTAPCPDGQRTLV